MPCFEHPHRRAQLIAVALVALATVAAGCSSDDPPASISTTERSSSAAQTSTTSTSSPKTTEAPEDGAPTTRGSAAEQKVIDRYIGYWVARFEANSGTPDPDDPALREHATGKQLDAVIAETQSNLDDGLAFERATDPHRFQKVTVVELGRDRAVVQECVVSDGVIFRRATGEVVNDDVATHNVRGELMRVDGVWRVSEARLVQQWKGVAGCALES